MTHKALISCWAPTCCWYFLPTTVHELLFDDYLLPSHTGLNLDTRNVLNVLHEAGFADADWELLAQQLIEHTALLNIKADCDKSTLRMTGTISQWLRTDLKPSWEKLAEAVAKIERYGEATAECVRLNAGIVHTCMFFVDLTKCHKRDNFVYCENDH